MKIIKLFIRERIKHDLTTAQKIIVYKFLINLKDAILYET